MKKPVVTLAVLLGASLLCAPSARAEYSLSVSYGSGHDRHESSHHNSRHHNFGHQREHFDSGHHYGNRGFIYVATTSRPVTVVREVQTTKGEKVGIADIIALSKAGVSDAVIMEKIDNTGSVFDLSVEEVEALVKEGVSSNVINHMLNTTR